MKFFKLVIVLFVFLFISGCSIDYTLVITDNYFDESISVVLDDSDNTNQALKDYNPIHYSDDIIYQKSIKNNNGKTNVNLYFRYTLEEFQNANSVNQGFYNRSIKEDDDIIYINLSNFEGFASKIDFDIKIKTNNEVLKNNADKVKGNTYIWHVDKNNKKNLSIEMEIKKGTAKNTNNNYQFITYIVIGIIVVIILVFVFMLLKRRKNSNRI